MRAEMKPTALVLLLIYAAFVSMGLPDGVLGAAWPQMRAELARGLNENWPMLALGTVGSAISSFASGALLRRFGVGRVLLVTTTLTGVVLLGYALGPTFTVIAGLAFLLGLGNGAVDAGLNNFVAQKLSSRHMNWLHACWGVGISLGTLMVSGVLAAGGSWRSAYLAVGSAQLMLALAFAMARAALPGATPATASDLPAHPSYGSTLRLPAAWVSLLAFATYCGLECSAGLWIASVLHDGRAWSTQAAGLMATLYWGSLTVGRFLIGIVSQRLRPIQIVRAALIGALAGTTLIAISSAGGATSSASLAAGLLLTGLSLAPIFPMLMHDTVRSVGEAHAVNLIGFQGAAGQLGFTLLPIAVGSALRYGSIELLGPLLCGFAVTLALLVALRERHIPVRG